MLESRRLAQPVEQPGRLQLAIMAWQRQLVDQAKVRQLGDRQEPTGVTTEAIPVGR